MDYTQYRIPDYISVYLLMSTAAILLVIFLGLRGRSSAKWPFYIVGSVIAWLGTHLMLAATGAYARELSPPWLPMAVFLTLALFLFLAFRPPVLERLREIGPARLTVFQTWRLIPEILILLLIAEALMPNLMTFTGRNLDIFAPLTAAPMAWLVFRKRVLPRSALVVWNAIAMAILAVTVFHGIFSAPFPFRIFHTEPANIAVLLFPVVLLPIFMVSLAFTVHIVSLKLLLEGNHESTEYLTEGPPGK